jgi:hypothetical protein
MALDYDVTKVKDAWFKVDKRTLEDEDKSGKISLFGPTRYEEDGETFQMEPILQTMVFLTMNIGINKITNRNKDKVLGRINFIESLTNPVMRLNGEPHPFDMDMVESCVGLTTNASTMTKSQFIKAQTQFLEL